MPDILNRMSQKSHPKRTELYNAISSEEFYARHTPTLILGGCRNRSHAEQLPDHPSRRFSRIHDAHVCWRNPPQERLQQRIMGATQNQNICRLETILKGFVQINARRSEERRVGKECKLR